MNKMPPPDYLQGAVIALDNQTGGIVALVGGRDFEHAQYDRALQARRPAGTAMKPFVYAAAFEHGMFPGTVVDDSALDNRAVMIGGTTGILGEWGPEREDNRYEGPMTARQALAKSKNSATVRLGMRAGLENVLELSKIGRHPVAAAAVSGDVPRRERSDAGRARARLHHLPERRLAARCAIHPRPDRGEGWHDRLAIEAGPHAPAGDEAGDGVRGALVPGRRAGKRHRRGRAAEVWASGIPRRRQDGHGLRFHRSALRRLQQRHHGGGARGVR